VNINELPDEALEYLVAKADGARLTSIAEFRASAIRRKTHRYLSSWACGGPIIEREKLMIEPKLESGDWYGKWRCVGLSWKGRNHSDVVAESALKAAMQGYLVSLHGYEFDFVRAAAETSRAKGGSE